MVDKVNGADPATVDDPLAPDKAGEGEQVSVEVTTEAAPPAASPEEGIEALKAQLAEKDKLIADERSARQEAERQAKEAGKTASARANDALTAQEQAITNALSIANGEKAAAKQALSAALEKGDFAAAADAQEAIADAVQKVRAIEYQKGQLDQYKAKLAETPAEPTLEDKIKNFSAPQQSWFRKNPQAITDQRTFKRAYAASLDAEADGLATDSPEWFAYIEKRLGIGHSDDGKTSAEITPDPVPKAPAQRPAPSAAAAPVSRSVPGGQSNGSNGRQVSLTAAERDIAVSIYPEMSEKDAIKTYAADKLALIESGDLPRA